jgi:hypothetical protein
MSIDGGPLTVRHAHPASFPDPEPPFGAVIVIWPEL